MIELMAMITATTIKDFKIALIIAVSTVLSSIYIFNLSGDIFSPNLYTLLHIALLILFIIALTYRLRSIKKGMKELYFTLPYHREVIYFAEVASTVFYSLILNIIASIPYLPSLDPLSYILSTILPSIFIGVTIVNMSDERWRNTFQWLIAIFILPFLAELSMYLFTRDVYMRFYWIFNLLPHEIYLSLTQIRSLLGFLNIGFNMVTYFIYLAASLYIGVYIRERRDIL